MDRALTKDKAKKGTPLAGRRDGDAISEVLFEEQLISWLDRTTHEEKMTDVNIAVLLLDDA